MKLLNWNVEWASPRHRPEILRRIKAQKAEVVCLTEAPPNLLDSAGGYSIYTGECPGSGNPRGCKVLLWSARPWREEAIIKELSNKPSFPCGRFISGVTRTSIGDLLVVGVCIPYMGSRTRAPLNERAYGQDQEEYLLALKPLIEKLAQSEQPFVLVGDFNQRLGDHIKYRYGSPPHRRRQMLDDVLMPLQPISAGFQFATKKQKRAKRIMSHDAIDHIALSASLKESQPLVALDNIANRQDHPNSWELLSDHFGIVTDLQATV